MYKEKIKEKIIGLFFFSTPLLAGPERRGNHSGSAGL